MDQMLRDARNLARRQPALFIGGSFAVGLLAARFVKSSPRDGNDWQGDQRDVSRHDSSTAYPIRDSVADYLSDWSTNPSAPDQEKF